MTPRRAEKIDAGCGRERLLQAAMHLFASRVTRRPRCATWSTLPESRHPPCTTHFGNKEGLFLAVCTETESRISAAEEEAMAGGGSAAARILRLGQTHIGLRQELRRLRFGSPSGSGLRPGGGVAVRLPGAPFSKRIRSFEQRLVEEGVASGEFRPCTARHAALACARRSPSPPVATCWIGIVAARTRRWRVRFR